MKNTLVAILFSCLIVSTCFAQAGKPEIKVKDIKAELALAPRYSMEGKNISSDQSKKWLVVEATLETEPDWADEITLKFHVVANYGAGAKNAPQDGFDILSTAVTVVNVPKGRKSLVPVFLDANTVKKYSPAGVHEFVPQVAVQVYYKGRLQDTYWMTGVQKGVQFWENKPSRSGILLNLMQSPWSPAYVDYYEQVKPSAPAPAGY